MYPQRQMESGKAVSLLVETFRIFSLDSRPIESGNVSRRLPETSSSTRPCNPAIESGIACWTIHLGQSKTSETQKLSFCKLFCITKNEKN